MPVQEGGLFQCDPPFLPCIDDLTAFLLPVSYGRRSQSGSNCPNPTPPSSCRDAITTTTSKTSASTTRSRLQDPHLHHPRVSDHRLPRSQYPLAFGNVAGPQLGPSITSRSSSVQAGLISANASTTSPRHRAQPRPRALILGRSPQHPSFEPECRPDRCSYDCLSSVTPSCTSWQCGTPSYGYIVSGLWTWAHAPPTTAYSC